MWFWSTFFQVVVSDTDIQPPGICQGQGWCGKDRLTMNSPVGQSGHLAIVEEEGDIPGGGNSLRNCSVKGKKAKGMLVNRAL